MYEFSFLSATILTLFEDDEGFFQTGIILFGILCADLVPCTFSPGRQFAEADVMGYCKGPHQMQDLSVVCRENRLKQRCSGLRKSTIIPWIKPADYRY